MQLMPSCSAKNDDSQKKINKSGLHAKVKSSFYFNTLVTRQATKFSFDVYRYWLPTYMITADIAITAGSILWPKLKTSRNTLTHISFGFIIKYKKKI